mgnify:CR=1 FL=1
MAPSSSVPPKKPSTGSASEAFPLGTMTALSYRVPPTQAPGAIAESHRDPTTETLTRGPTMRTSPKTPNTTDHLLLSHPAEYQLRRFWRALMPDYWVEPRVPLISSSFPPHNLNIPFAKLKPPRSTVQADHEDLLVAKDPRTSRHTAA